MLTAACRAGVQLRVQVELNALVRALNLVARLLHRRIRWDTETLGCVPSLSSIPAMEQRALRDALREIREWMDRVRGY